MWYVKYSNMVHLFKTAIRVIRSFQVNEVKQILKMQVSSCCFVSSSVAFLPRRLLGNFFYFFSRGAYSENDRPFKLHSIQTNQVVPRYIKIITSRPATLLPRIISKQQKVSVEGRLIIDSVLLPEELVKHLGDSVRGQ